MNLRDLIERVGAQARKSGFRTPGFTRSVAEHVALITTEVGELYEAHRDGHHPAELWYEHTAADGSKYVNASRISRGAMGREIPGKPVGIPSELADIVIRACDMADEWGIDLATAIDEKMAHNATRPLKHGRQS